MQIHQKSTEIKFVTSLSVIACSIMYTVGGIEYRTFHIFLFSDPYLDLD